MSLRDCPIPGATGFCQPEGSGSLGVLILGEAMGEAEAHDSLPFRPYAMAGAVLERAIRRSGFNRSQFVIYNTVPTHPPHNYLEHAPYEAAAVAWGMEHVKGVINAYKPKCILALGNIPTSATTGARGGSLGVTSIRGFVIPSHILGIPVVPALHPAFLRRGAMTLFSTLMHDLKLAVAVAAGGAKFYSPVLSRDYVYTPRIHESISEPLTPLGYITHPTEADAWRWFDSIQRDDIIAYDIETPRSTEVTEDESDELGDTHILSIQFSSSVDTGIFLPWREPFVEIARRVLALPNAKAGANTWRFDDPLLKAAGCRLNGTLHDVRWAWHHLQPDLKASLQFVSSFYVPFGPWKSLHSSHPAFYGIRDVDAIQWILKRD